MSRRLNVAVPPDTPGDEPEPSRRGAAVRLDDLVRLNPGLRPGDVLALWCLPGPSARTH